MACSSCKNLDESKRVKGAVSGAKYYCKKKKACVYGDRECEAYEKSYIRKNSKCDDIYNDGREYYDDDRPVSQHIAVLVFIIVFGTILKIFT